MIRRVIPLFCVAVLAGAAAVPALTIKLGTIAPAGSPWDKAVRKISSEWSTISGGAINFKIYPGGIAGDENDMIRKMRIDQLNSAALSGIGVTRIYNGVLAMQLPMVIRTDEELDYVLPRMESYFEQKLAEQGFIMLTWTKVGWAHFYAKKPVVTVADLQAQKLFVMAGDEDADQIWKASGFKPVPLSPNDLMTSLQSGMVEALTTSPLAAAAGQTFGLTPNMCGLKWAPIIGGVVISKKSWDKIPADMRPKLLASAQKIGATMQGEIDAADRQSIDIMKKYGLKISTVPPAAEEEWKKVAERACKAAVGKSFDEQSYTMILKLLAEFRSQKPAGATAAPKKK